MNENRGFSAIEILIVLVIIGMITAIVLVSSSGAISSYEISRVSRGVASQIEKARTEAVYSKESSKWSIKLFSNRSVLFKGTSYTEGGVGNEEYSFGNRVVIATTSLAISTSTITFDRITGRTSNSGTILLWLSSATTSSSTITVQKTGIIEVR